MITKERDPFLWLAPYLAVDDDSYQEYASQTLRRLERYFAANGCEAADDLASESLLRLTKRLVDAEPEGPETEPERRGFLFGIAKNVLAEWRRRPGARETGLREEDAQEFSLPPIDLIGKQCLELLRQTMSESLAKLEPAEQDILTQTVLNAEYRRTLAEMAREKGIRANTMRQNSSRTRRRLEKMLLASTRIHDLLRCLGLSVRRKRVVA